MCPRREILRWILRWSGRCLLALLAFVILVTVVGCAWQAVSAFRDARRYAARGELVDLGGRSLHLDCRGEGKPTVVIEAGVQDWSTGWQRPQAAIARRTRVCSYDRAGLGWSDPSDDPKDGFHMVQDLHELLAAANISRPVVLVGHSLGGMLNRIYYERHPHEVAGMVLLEPGDPGQISSMFPNAGGEPAFGGWVETVASLAARLGVVRWMYRDLFEDKGYPEREVAESRARIALSQATRAVASTVRHLPVTARQTRANEDLGSLPLVVVYSSRFDEVGTHFESEEERQEFRVASVAAWESVARLSTRGREPLVIDGANHVSLVRDDRYWPLVVEVILEVVETVRRSDADPRSEAVGLLP